MSATKATGGCRVCNVCDGEGTLRVKNIETQMAKVIVCPVQQCRAGICAPGGELKRIK
jgi:hypothetical protein